jgi:AraC family L-rhamnose operon regulatory protein RhaS
MLTGTRGLEYYPAYVTPVNYYEGDNALYEAEDFNCYRLVFIEEGIGSLSLNGKELSIIPHTVLCLNEKDTIKNIDFTCRKLRLLCFLPSAINNILTFDNISNDTGMTISDSQDKQFLLPFILHNETYSKYKYVDVETGTRILDIMKSLKEQLFIQSDSWPCLTRSYLLELLFLLERTYSIRPVSHNNNKKFSTDEVLLYLHNNYRKKITIGELVKRFNTNQTTLSKEFKNATGQTIISYVLKLRVLIAAGMLRDTTLKIELIIERVGFNNITHFNKVFKEYHQCLPNEYRKRFKPY